MDTKLQQYQDFCKKGLQPGCDLVVYALGLGGESGEVLDIIKKGLRDQKPIDKDHLKEELGDVLWYIANICSAYRWSIEEVIDLNISKLKKRYHL